MMRFNDRKVQGLEAAGGIAQAAIAPLRREGAQVATSDRDTSALEADPRIDGDLTEATFADALAARAADALGGLDTGAPREVASLIAWLGSEDAGFVTSQVYTIDGGRTAKLSLP